MTSDRARRLRHPWSLAGASVLATLLAACTGPAVGGRTAEDTAVEDVPVTVMTRNLYVGTPLGDAFAASSWDELVAAGSRAWATLLANDFPTRADALADEIVGERPDVVGLQEVTLWREQAPGDVRTRPGPDAVRVVLDHLALLRDALRDRGLPYTAVVTSANVDLEFPRVDPGGGLVDVRLTDRDVLLVRSDLADRVGNPGTGHFTAQFTEPFPTGPVTSTRGWTSIDYRPTPTTTVRIVNTHLEVGGPATGTTQEEQGAELLALIAASPHPVIALGDLNSPADGSATPTYRNLTAALRDVWTAARPAEPGGTCCQPLADPVDRAATRIDLVLTSEEWPVTRVERTGHQPFRAGPPPVWASDHVGVTARVVVPGG